MDEPITPAEVHAILDRVLPLTSELVSLELAGEVVERDGTIQAILRLIVWDTHEGERMIRDVKEQEAVIVSAGDRSRRDRLEAYLTGWASAVQVVLDGAPPSLASVLPQDLTTPAIFGLKKAKTPMDFQTAALAKSRLGRWVGVPPDWDERYREQPVEEMPWYFAELDPDVARALEAHRVRGGLALDLGTGPGTQAIALAERNFRVIATDISPRAVELARERAERGGVDVDFRQDDILATALSERFDLILDRGCFHVMSDEQRPRYLAAIATLAAPGGLLFLKTFSDEQPGTIGPRRCSPEEIRTLFEPSFEVLSIERTVYHGTLDPMPRALFAVLRRLNA